ncbi:MAG: excinuclease ABC subunit UvrA [Phycisphaerales bacterium]|nr:excinuclease ABC subunit UvrA [Phycisphaerales bacterium]
MEPKEIVIRGARVHNLKNVSLRLPRNQLICLTGVSGSGKSSLAFDTLHAEGQRRYLESLSSYARQFLGQVAKPDVDLITGLSPTVSIQQKSTGWNPRSTVGTVTQIHDFLRVLFARIGTQHCTLCDRLISAQTRDQILAAILSRHEGARVFILAPVARQQKGEFRDLFAEMTRRGYARARADGEFVRLSESALDRDLRHDVDIVVDRVDVKPAHRSRLAQSIEQALELGGGTLIVRPADEDERPKTRSAAARDTLLSANYACVNCGISFEPPTPQMFSFNAPAGMCPACDGLGTLFDFDADLLVPDSTKSFLNLAIEPMRVKIGRWRLHIYEAVARHLKIRLSSPWKGLPPAARHALLHGTGDTHLTYEWNWSGGVWRHGGTFDGIISELRDKHRKAQSALVRRYYEKYMRMTDCTTCRGARLNPQALAVRICGTTIHQCSSMSIAEALAFVSGLELTDVQEVIAHDALLEIRSRLQFLVDVGVDYLSLQRPAPSLSGGESQRIRLAAQIGSGLTGVLYVLDEPSIGLHARDNQRLLNSLIRLRDMGNTVVVVEHDEETMRTADTIVDFGPGPGDHGGHVVANGDLNAIMNARKSVTGRYLSGLESIAVPATRRPVHRSSPAEKQARRRMHSGSDQARASRRSAR